MTLLLILVLCTLWCLFVTHITDGLREQGFHVSRVGEWAALIGGAVMIGLLV